MIYKFSGCLYFFLLSFLIYGQNNKIKGVVLFQNSNKTPATGVQIFGQGANTQISKSYGQFLLTFTRKKAGDVAGLGIGPNTAHNQYIEWVNKKELENTRIPSDLNDTIRIIVALSGQIIAARQKYYDAMDKKLTQNYEKLLARQQKLLKEKGLSQKAISALNQQKDSLEHQYNQALKTIDELAGYISRINKDFASDIVKDAIRMIDESQDIEKALNILDLSKLDAAYTKAVEKKLAAEAEILQVIEGYQLRISLLIPALKYDEAIVCYDKIIKIAEANAAIFPIEELAALYDKAGDKCREFGFFSKSLEYALHTLRLATQELPEDHHLMAEFYDKVGNSYSHLVRYDSALFYLKKAEKIWAGKAAPNAALQFTNYFNIGFAYSNLKEYKIGLDYKLKALEVLLNQKDEDHSALETLLYSSISVAYQHLGDEENRLLYEENALANSEAFKGDNPVSLTNKYWLLGEENIRKGDVKAAISNYLEAIKVQSKVVSSKNVALLTSYFKVANLYLDQTDFASAENYFQKAKKLSAEIYPPTHQFRIDCDLKLGTVEFYKKNYDKAAEYFLQPLSLDISKLDTVSLYDTYSSLIFLSMFKGDFDSLNKYLNELEPIIKSATSSIANSVSITYNDISKAFFMVQSNELGLTVLNLGLRSMQEKYFPFHPDIGKAHLAIGFAYSNVFTDIREKAIFHYKQATKIFEFAANKSKSKTRLGEAYSGLAFEYAQTDQVDSTIKYLALTEELYEDWQDATYSDASVIQTSNNLSLAYYYHKKYNKALTWLQRNLKVGKSNYGDINIPGLFDTVYKNEIAIRKAIAKQLYENQAYQKTIPHYERILFLNKDIIDKANTLHLIGLANFKSDSLVAARKAFSEEIMLRSEIADNYFKAKDFEKAVPHYERIFHLSADHEERVSALNWIGLAYTSANNLEAAALAFDSLLQFEPKRITGVHLLIMGNGFNKAKLFDKSSRIIGIMEQIEGFENLTAPIKAEYFVFQGAPEKALNMLSAYVEAGHFDWVDSISKLALPSLFQLKDYQKLIKKIEKIKEKDNKK